MDIDEILREIEIRINSIRDPDGEGIDLAFDGMLDEYDQAQVEVLNDLYNWIERARDES